MRCYYHHGKEAVGICKSCYKALCTECAVDIGKGLACKGRCEGDAKAIMLLIERNIQLLTTPPKAQLLAPRTIPQNARPAEQVAIQLTTRIKQTRYFRRGLGIFF